MVMYDIWKITGQGRQSRRYYESNAMFQKYFKKWNNGNYSKTISWKAYRFSDNGWIEIPRP